MRSLLGPLAGLAAAIFLGTAAVAAPTAPAKHEITAGESLVEKVHGVVYYSDVVYGGTYYSVHTVPWVYARRHWYPRYYQPAHVEPFKYYPYYFYTPRYIYTPHYKITRSHYRRSRR